MHLEAYADRYLYISRTVDGAILSLLDETKETVRLYQQVEAARGDWIVYYEPRRPSGDLMKTGGRQAYFATARIADIIEETNSDVTFLPEVGQSPAHVASLLGYDHRLATETGLVSR
mgnify:CR=1 FL=1